MLSELNKEMEKRSFEAIIVLGRNVCSPELYYFVRAQIPRGGIYLKKMGESATLILGNVDVKSGEKSNVKDIKTFTEYGYEKLIKKYGLSKALIYFYDRLIKYHGIEAKIGIYGVEETGVAYHLIRKLKNKGHKIVCELPPNLLDRLMETKDKTEISDIKNIGASVEKILSKTIDMIYNKLSKGNKVTIGEAKKFTRILMAEENLLPAEDFILSSGTNTADPHCLGEHHKQLKVGTPIVMDFYPRGRNLLYFDITRTIVVGRSSNKIKQMYEHVMDAQTMAYDALREDMNGSELMEKVCNFFEGKKYPTIRNALYKNKMLESGFIHSLGHGVGWSLSDLPIFSLTSEDKLKKGHVFTIEPGLYKPRVGGIRIEDVYALTDGRVEELSELDKTLER